MRNGLIGSGRAALWLFMSLMILMGLFGVAGLGVGASSDANDSFSVQCYATPSAMVLPGEAKVEIALGYYGESFVDNVRVLDENANVLETVGRLDPKKKEYVYTQNVTLTAEQLDQNGVAYKIVYVVYGADGQPQEKTRDVVASVIKKPAEARIEFTRTFSSDRVAKDSEVTITYRVRNVGNVPLQNVSLEDELCGEVGTVDVLDVGKRHIFTAKIKVSHTCVSRPSVYYTHAASKSIFTEGLSASTIYLADERLNVALESDKNVVSPGEVATLRLKIVNEGNVSYENLRVSDQQLGDLGIIPAEIKPGDSYTFSKSVNMKSTTTFLFAVGGRNSNGDEFVQHSNMLTVAVTPALSNIVVDLGASAEPQRLYQPGTVTMTVQIDNQGSLDIRNAILYEKTRGELKRLAVLAPGVTDVELRFDVSATEAYTFYVNLTDAQGGQLTLISNTVTVEMLPGPHEEASSAQPMETLYSDIPVQGVPYQLNDSPAFEGMMFGVLALLATMFVAIGVSVSVRRRRARKKRLIRQRRLRRMKDQDEQAPMEKQQTRPHKPIDVRGRRGGGWRDSR